MDRGSFIYPGNFRRGIVRIESLMNIFNLFKSCIHVSRSFFRICSYCNSYNCSKERLAYLRGILFTPDECDKNNTSENLTSDSCLHKKPHLKFYSGSTTLMPKTPAF